MNANIETTGTMGSGTETREQEARRLRELIYGPTSDAAWGSVEKQWVADLVWLRRVAAGGERAVVAAGNW